MADNKITHHFFRRLDIGADPRRRRRMPIKPTIKRGEDMSLYLACRITFRPENPIAPAVELLTAMCIIKERPILRVPRPANENLRASA